MKAGYRLASVFLACALVCAGASCSGQEPRGLPALRRDGGSAALVPFEGTFTPAHAVDNMEFIAQKGYAAMYANMDTGAFAIEDMRTQRVFYSNPPAIDSDGLAVAQNYGAPRSQIVVTDLTEEENVMLEKASYDSVYERGGLFVEALEDGIRVMYYFNEEYYAIAAEYILCEDGFRVWVPTDRIEELGAHRIYGISLLPYFGAQGGEGDGYLLVADGSGARIRFDSQKQESAPYYHTIYGDDYLAVDSYAPNRHENVALPVIGMQAQAGGFLAIADNGAAAGTVNAGVDGRNSSYNHIYFGFDLRKRQAATIGDPKSFNATNVQVYEKGNVAVGAVSVRYVLLDSTPENGLAAMAEVTRRYMEGAAGGKKPDTVDNPLYISTLGGYLMKKSVLGVRREVTVPVNTFSDTLDMMERLKALGVDTAGLLYEGYDTECLRHRLTSGVRLDGRVGSADSLNRLGGRLGKNRLFLSVNPVVYRRSSGDANNQASAIRDLSQNRYTLRTFRRNTYHPDKNTPDAYILKADLALGILKSQAADIRARFPGAAAYVTGISHMAYGDYSAGGIRRELAVQMARDTAAGLDRPFVSDNANFDFAMHSSAVVNAPASSSQYDVLDESVPFYQMVLSGGRQLISRPLNSYGDADQAFLACIRFGMVPHYELTTAAAGVLKGSGLDSYYASDFSVWGEQVARRYKEYKPLFERIKGMAITNYHIHDTDVTETVYENGVRLFVNTGADRAAVAGQTIDAMSFVTVG